MRKMILQTAILVLCVFSFTRVSAQIKPSAELLASLKNQSYKIHISSQDIDDGVITDDYTDKSTGIQHVYLQQAYKNIKV
ncbi:MAG: hypothetical protein ACJ748_15660, partial [Flavisolibacter sp.]